MRLEQNVREIIEYVYILYRVGLGLFKRFSIAKFYPVLRNWELYELILKKLRISFHR